MIQIGIVGATGLVGRELISILRERGWPSDELRLFASTRHTIEVAGRRHVVHRMDISHLSDCDVVFLAAPASVAKRLALPLVRAGVLVVDNSSAYRASAKATLVVPEVNPERIRDSLLVANPNCSTILLLVAVAPLHRKFGCRSVNVSTYQAVSGAGAHAVQELKAQTAEYLDTGRRRQFAFNIWSHESPVDTATGLNQEEQKMVTETKRILGDRPRVSPTCIRVPVERVHGESVTVKLETLVSESDFRHVLSKAPGLELLDDRMHSRFPTAHAAIGGDAVLVGRIRKDPAAVAIGETADTYQFWLTGDQIRKGAALNAVQIAEQHPRLERWAPFIRSSVRESQQRPFALL